MNELAQNYTLPENFYDLSITESEQGILCISALYGPHILTAYMAVFSGIVALVSRLNPKWKKWHVWGGRGFIVSIVMCQATAMLIYTTGLPRPIMFLLSILTVFMSVGWLVIKYREPIIEKKIIENAEAIRSSGKGKAMTVEELIDSSKKDIFSRPRTFRERFFSLKALHGICMGFAWWQMAGRAFVTNPFIDHKCDTYPFIKPGSDYGTAGTPVGPYRSDLKLTSTMWFALYTTIPCVLVVLAVGLGWSYIAAAREAKKPINDDNAVDLGRADELDSATE